MSLRTLPLAVLPLMLTACGGDAAPERNLASLDQELTETATGNGVDPVLKGALNDEIMVDPALAARANGDAVRPPNQPYATPVPPESVAPPPPVDSASLKPAPAPSKDCPGCKAAAQARTLGALAERQAGGGAGCARRMQYNAGWANRLPADLPLYPGARVTEAAGADGGGCSLRAVSFSTSAGLKTTIDWYYTKLSGAGYSAEHQSDGAQHVLGGARQGAGYLLFMSKRADGGTDVDLIANGGR